MNATLWSLLYETLAFGALLLFTKAESLPLLGGLLGLLALLVAAAARVGFSPARVWSEAVAKGPAPLVKGVAVLFLLAFPAFYQGQPYWVHVAVMSLIYVLMALGLNIMAGSAGLISLGHAAFYAVGAYTSGLLATRLGLPFWVTLPVAGLAALVFGLVLGLPALRVRGHYLALVTIAFGIVVNLTITNLSWTGGPNGVVNIPPPHLGGYSFNEPLRLGGWSLPFQANYYYLALLLVYLAVRLAVNLNRSPLGLTWNAIREDQIAAECYGIDLSAGKLLAFAVGSFLAGVAGAVYASLAGFISPESFAQTISTLVLSMVILGGLDSVPGVVAGAVLLTVIPEKFRVMDDYRLLLYGVVIILMLLFRPEGLLPARNRRYEPPTAEPEAGGAPEPKPGRAAAPMPGQAEAPAPGGLALGKQVRQS